MKVTEVEDLDDFFGMINGTLFGVNGNPMSQAEAKPLIEATGCTGFCFNAEPRDIVIWAAPGCGMGELVRTLAHEYHHSQTPPSRPGYIWNHIKQLFALIVGGRFALEVAAERYADTAFWAFEVATKMKGEQECK